LHVLTQSHRVEVHIAVCRIVEFNVRNLGCELALAGEIEITAGRIPDWTPRIEHIVGDAVQLVISGVPNKERRKTTAPRGHAEREIVSGWRKDVVANLSAWRVGNFSHLLVSERDDVQLPVFVTERDALSIR